MSELEFESDIRSQDPNETRHRQARFREGWRKAVAGERYNRTTLRELTWDNLGWLFGQTSPDLVDEIYDWCVKQQVGHGTA
jgi:hypothetical protein